MAARPANAATMCGTTPSVQPNAATTPGHEVRASTTLFERPWADLHYPDDMEQRVRSTWAALDPSGALGEECWTAVARKVAAWEAADNGECDANRAELVEKLFGYVGTPDRSAATLRHWCAATTFAELGPRSAMTNCDGRSSPFPSCATG